MRVSTGSKPKADQMPSKNGPYAAMVLHTARYQQVYKTPEVPVSTIDLEKALSLQTCGLPAAVRGERLSISEFAALSRALRREEAASTSE